MNNFALSEQSLLIAVIAGAFVTMAMLAIIVNQQRKINTLQTRLEPKYGFLGKPLVAITLAVLSVGGIGLTYYATNNIQNVVVNADDTVEITINTAQVGPVQNGRQNVKFEAVLAVEAKQWGNPGDTFDVFWNITGVENITQLELMVSGSKHSGFNRLLKPGNYEIVVDVIYKNKRFTKKQALVVTL